MSKEQNIYLGQQSIKIKKNDIQEQFIEKDGETYYKIENYQAMAPFFMTISSDTNHWMFISSTGGLTAGRVNSESALFPYYTDDRITEDSVNTGPKTLILVEKDNKRFYWEPFNQSMTISYDILSILYKNIRGNMLIFEEINETLGLSFSYKWMNSKKYGWIRKSSLKNMSENPLKMEIIDGLQNILPAGISSKVQNTFSNLLNAYKKCEIESSTGMGIFALSATLTDLAEPSESLKANVLWSCGINNPTYLLSDRQLEAFISGTTICEEEEVKGERCGYFIHTTFALDKNEEKTWYIAADVDKDHKAINDLNKTLLDNTLNGPLIIEDDVRKGSERLDAILAQNDGIQSSAGKMNCVHHQANVMYNIMRGGYFYDSYKISIPDLNDFIYTTNRFVGERFEEVLNRLGEEVDYNKLLTTIVNEKNSNLTRIWYEYLPLTFSRRHGDPSRPWNIFSIETEKADGSPKLDYQGNWRDIFQNWEALSYSYPFYIRHIIGKFLNATTADGYNPYRISRKGIDWEVLEPDNPWSNIGYWSDHQIIYLLKMLEMYKQFFGGKILSELNDREYSFADIPYEIKPFNEILQDPYNTIVFNEEKHNQIKTRGEMIGAEGKMLHSTNGSITLANMTEKFLILLLTKLGNFVPYGGIWMNTQRPEWNDANNALAGKGLSVVTLAYVRRYISFLMELYGESNESKFILRTEILTWFQATGKILTKMDQSAGNPMNSRELYKIVESLGTASGDYRKKLYIENLNQGSETINRGEMLTFLTTSLRCIDASLKANKREDNLFHSYNTLEIGKGTMRIHPLYEMLEGQVAILSSRLLSGEETLKTIDALRSSALFREDQNSYMLYPDRNLPTFLEKNNIDPEKYASLELLKQLVKEDNRDLVTCDASGLIHFNGDFHNVRQVQEVLEKLKARPHYTHLIEIEGSTIENLFEETFDHQSYTGRSGTFFAFEGLGSIYWHMVSKLLLAVQENLFRAVDEKAPEALIEGLKDYYYQIREGIGYNKSAKVYGAFPFDPYSHTPAGKGAKQPGMTGQVKEEIITRLAETGIRIIDGKISMNGTLIDDGEFYSEAVTWEIRGCKGDKQKLNLPARSLGATFCQTPYIVKKSAEKSVTVHFADASKETLTGAIVPEKICRAIYRRTGEVRLIEFIV